MSSYTVIAERSGRWWSLQCVEFPGAISQVSRLSQADVIKEAIAFVADVPQETVEIELRPVIAPEALKHLQSARQLREESAKANRRAAEEARLAARALASAGLSVRDMGIVMGVSFQRAQQLLKDDNLLV